MGGLCAVPHQVFFVCPSRAKRYTYSASSMQNKLQTRNAHYTTQLGNTKVITKTWPVSKTTANVLLALHIAAWKEKDRTVPTIRAAITSYDLCVYCQQSGNYTKARMNGFAETYHPRNKALQTCLGLEIIGSLFFVLVWTPPSWILITPNRAH